MSTDIPDKQIVPEAPKHVVYPYDPGRTLAEKSRRDMIREAYSIAEMCPAMIVEDLKNGGWLITFDDEEYPGDYAVEAKGTVDLLREVKVAKECYEAALKNRERALMEKKKQDSCASPSDLSPSTKKVLLHLMRIVDNMSLGEIAKTIGDDYIGDVLYEMFVIKRELKK